MANDYLPCNDLAFADWFQNFIGYLGENYERFGLTEAQFLALGTSSTAFSNALLSYYNLRDQAKAASKVKRTQRDNSESLVRPAVVQIQANPSTTEMDREMLRIPMRGEPSFAQGIEIEDNKPQAIVDIRQRLRHVLRIQNESTISTSKAKPAGVMGAEVWVKVGDAPETEAEYQFAGLATRSPYQVDYAEGDGNKPAHYRLRWVTSRGEKSAWSEVETATIAA